MTFVRKIKSYFTETYFKFLALGLVINTVLIIPIYFISYLLDTKTYHGNEGHNKSFATLVVLLLIWLVIFKLSKVRTNKSKFNGYKDVLICATILLGCFSVVEIYS